MNDITLEVCVLLKAFGYNPYVSKYTTNDSLNMVDISFAVNNGSESLPQRYKDAISMLVKGYLSEFYYQNDIQHVKLYNDHPDGLEPDDNRYSCLIKEMIHVKDNTV